jgi:hypothetical protein
MTPEGKTKASIKNVLDLRKPYLYYDMPVPNGYGKSTLDFICCYYARYFAIEAKRATKKPTSRQDGTREDMIMAGATVFVINDDAGCEKLDAWLTEVERTSI